MVTFWYMVAFWYMVTFWYIQHTGTDRDTEAHGDTCGWRQHY